MAIDLAALYAKYVDEQFTSESQTGLVTNNDFQWDGVDTIKVYKISTSAMNDYDRAGEKTATQWSRYGVIKPLDAVTEVMTLSRDRSFTFVLDKLDVMETGDNLNALTALARQNREVVIPEIDKYVYGKIIAGAGEKPTAITLTADNIFDEILKANNALDNAEVPTNGRVIIVTPDTYQLMKKNSSIVMNTDIGQDMRIKGVISNLDGANVIKVPASHLPDNFGFAVCHPVATVKAEKLAECKVHDNPPGISGYLVEGRYCYDAFVLDNKKAAIYYQENKPSA
ncbi:hypothetical protein ACG98G_08325 [Megasphaera hexanoica]|uniref:Capsid protein n=1 Tax=Megasphaera hexanoica TaxID=1675036 RepID=A0ABW7DNB7_9FIRM|nr:hypothetical protein [Megasphaera hexanoica]AXB81513.1 hypothetical protein ACT01_04255 [Megasphaera hexanoica]